MRGILWIQRRAAALVAVTPALCLIGLLPLFGQGFRTAVLAHGDAGGCTDRDAASGALLSTRVFTPSASILLCETAGVSMTVRAACEGAPVHVMISLDTSGSMRGTPIDDARDAALALVDTLEDAGRPGTKVGVVIHRDPPTLLLRPTDNLERARIMIEAISAGGEDNLAESVEVARAELIRESRITDPPPVMLMIVVTDGGQTYSPRNAVSPARAAGAAGIVVATICLENGLGDCRTVSELASEPRFSSRDRDTSGLRRAFTELAAIALDIGLRSIEVEETLPAGIDLVPDSAGPPAEYDPDTRTLRWTAEFVGSAGLRLGYLVRPSAVTTYTLAMNRTSYRSTRGSSGTLEIPDAVLTVTDECPGAPTPTPPPTNTATATQTPSPTMVPPPTASPTDPPPSTSTPAPMPIYLPTLNPWRCIPSLRPADTVLLIDASTSMLGSTAGGRPKLEAAREGAAAFIAMMRPSDRTAVLAFNDSVIRHSGLTEYRAALLAAVAAIDVAPNTRIDLALDAAAAELGDEILDVERQPIIILMTDGLPTGTTAEAVRDAAARARGSATIFSIGVGPDVDPELLADVAGEPTRYFPADDAEALAEIYRAISERIPCERSF